MLTLIKKTTCLLLVVVFLQNYCFAGIEEFCVDNGKDQFFPVGDERGNSVLVKEEVHQTCTLSIKTQGACLEWETKTENNDLSGTNYNSFRSSNFEDAFGSLLAVMSAYDQLEHLWSGWHGYCEKGTKHDFSWASDPFFWASLMAQVIMDGSAKPTEINTGSIDFGSNIAKESSMSSGGFLYDTTIGQSYNNMMGNLDSMWSSLGSSLGMKLGENMGKCLMAAGLDMASALYSGFTNNPNENYCDPVDEFCDDEMQTTSEGDVMTMDKQVYDDFITQHPEAAEYLILISEDDGIVTVRYKKVSEMDGFDGMSQDELNALKEKMRNMMMLIKIGLAAGKLALCGFTGGSWGSTNNIQFGGNNSAGTFSVKDGAGMAINLIPASWLGPYGALIKAAMAIMLEFIYSFKKINTCDDEDDANEAGTRHKKTQESLPYNLCKQTDEKCVQKKFLGSGCGLTGYDYCCYDQILTKILVTQLKAQLGRDWAHCTGITLRDLQFVSFRQCTAYDKTFGVDGANVVLKYNVEGKLTNPYDPKTSYQYIRKCIDLTEFKEYMEATINKDIDFSDFDSVFDDLQNNM